MAEHERITAGLDLPVYFCAPHHPWQRGTNENTNGLLRQYLPKSADLRTLTQDDLDRIAARLNDRPRCVLDWEAPARARTVTRNSRPRTTEPVARSSWQDRSMAATRLPELDVARVEKYCANRVPEHLRHEIRVECDIAPGHLTICECHPPWHEDSGPDWTRFPIARLQFTKKTGLWTLYWRDRNLAFHRYQPLAPSRHVQDLLDHIENSGDPIFWG
jgi:hypothetical protein